MLYKDNSEINLKNQLLLILKKVGMHTMFEYLVKETYCWNHNNTLFRHFDMDTIFKQPSVVVFTYTNLYIENKTEIINALSLG